MRSNVPIFWRRVAIPAALVLSAAMVLLLPSMAFAADYIRLDSSGWNDPTVGTWDPVAKIGTLERDLACDVDVFGVTLDGAGHKITGYVWMDVLIRDGQRPGHEAHIETSNGVVKNASITGTVNLGPQSTITRCDVDGTLSLGESQGDATVLGNSISGYGSETWFWESGARYVGNVFDRCSHGLSTDKVIAKEITDNQFIECQLIIDERSCPITDNVFVRCDPAINVFMASIVLQGNDFIDCPTPLALWVMEAYGGQTVTAEGNYWSDHVSPDANADGIVDIPRYCGVDGHDQPIYDSTARTTPNHPLDGMEINAGDALAASSEVTVNSSRDAVEMRIRNAGGEWAPWQPYAASVAWTLAAGDGEKTIDVEYRDAGDKLVLVTDSIEVSSLKQQALDLRDLVNAEVASGGLVGAGGGKSSGAKLDSFARKIETAAKLIEDGDYASALSLLQSAYGLCDGQPKPTDSVTGSARDEVATRILALIDGLQD